MRQKGSNLWSQHLRPGKNTEGASMSRVGLLFGWIKAPLLFKQVEITEEDKLHYIRSRLKFNFVPVTTWTWHIVGTALVEAMSTSAFTE